VLAQEVIEEDGAIEHFIVLESNLVTYGAGLEIQKIIPGYDLCQVVLQLPVDTMKEDIEDLFLRQGLAISDFRIHTIENEGKSLLATVITKLQHGKKNVLDGLRKSNVDVSHNAIWQQGEFGSPSLTLTWDSSFSNRRMTRSSSSDSPSVAFSTIYEMLCDSEGAQMKTCQFFNSDANSELDRESLILEFNTWANAQLAARTIEAKNIPSLECNVQQPYYHYSIRVPLAQYEAQKRQWFDLTKRKRKQEASLEIKTVAEESVTIQVEGKNMRSLGVLNRNVEKLMKGEILEGTYWHPSFASSEDSATFFQSLIDKTAVHLRSDPEFQTLRLYGETKRVRQARGMIQDEVEQREQVMTETKLTGASAAFFKREGLGKLQELVGEDEVNLKATPKKTTIMVRGGAEVTHHFRRLLGKSFVAEAGHGTENNPTCPVCLDEASYPERLPCGHAYCPGCLNSLLTAVVDNKTFPIMCIGNEATCHVPIALPFIRQFLTPYSFKRLLEAAFAAYLEQNTMQFQYCRTSGCKQTYRRQTISNADVISCPSCLARSCSSCGVEHDDDLSCEEYEIRRQETQFVDLARLKGYRRCPKCNVVVEKLGGCDNMYCRCNTFVSWLAFKDV